MDNTEEQNIENLANSNIDKENNISINEKEKNIYPFSRESISNIILKII